MNQGPLPPQAPVPPQAPRAQSDYEICQRIARSTGRPLAVFVGQKCRKVVGWVTCEAQLAVEGPCVVVVRNGDVWRLPGRPTDEEIQAAGQKKVALEAQPPLEYAPPFTMIAPRGGRGC